MNAAFSCEQPLERFAADHVERGEGQFLADVARILEVRFARILVQYLDGVEAVEVGAFFEHRLHALTPRVLRCDPKLGL